MITGFELKHLRREIGASLSQMADLLGLSGEGAADAMRKMENGAKTITGPIQRLARYMQEGVAEPAIASYLPEFLIGSDLAGQISEEWVLHTRYPRFLAIVTEQPVVDAECVSVDGVEWLTVALWIDEPVEPTAPLLQRAAALFAAYSNAAALQELNRE